MPEYSLTTRAMKRGTAFGFAGNADNYGRDSGASEKNVASQLGRLLHYENSGKKANI